MQAIRIPYRCSDEDRAFLRELRRVQSSAVRVAYANAQFPDGAKRTEKEVREIVKSRFTKLGLLDSWAMHCATRMGMVKRKLRPEGRMVFGGKKNFERRRKGLISNEQWREKRHLPFVSYGDRQKARGNQNIHLLEDHTIVVKIGRIHDGKLVTRKATLDLARMHGNAGKIMRQIAAICAKPDRKDRLNVMYEIGETHVSIIFDPEDLPLHPHRKVPVKTRVGRCLGIDLNPNWIGMAVVENVGDAASLKDSTLLEHALVKLDLPKDASAELVRETLAAIVDRAISLAPKHGCGAISVEKGLGKLRSSGRNRSLNRLLNYWARTVFAQMLTRRAGLAGIEVMEIWGGYSTTIGNLAFEAPDACASACEMARRGIARLADIKDVLPAFGEGWRQDLRKDLLLPVDAKGWTDVHRTIKAAKIGYRRPHPDVPSGTPVSDILGTRTFLGHAVARLRRRRRPGAIFRAAPMKQRASVRTLARQLRRVAGDAVPTTKSV